MASAKKVGKRPRLSARCGLVFNIGQVAKLLKDGQYAGRVGRSAAVYLTAVVEYLTCELLELADRSRGTVSKKKVLRRLTPRVLNVAIRSDDDMGALLRHVTLSEGGVMASHSVAKSGASHAKPKVSKEKKSTAATAAAPAPADGGRLLTRQESLKAERLFRAGALSHKWQYKTDGGKWADYDKVASDEVERVYAAWLVNPHVDVRSVHSGDWDYTVDFNAMTQMNIRHHAHKTRSIQRVPA